MTLLEIVQARAARKKKTPNRKKKKKLGYLYDNLIKLLNQS